MPPSSYLLVRTGRRRIGLALAAVREVVDVTDILPVPVVERAIRGVMPVRGGLVPLLHLGAYLEGSPCPSVRGEVAVLTEVAGRPLALEVDEAVAVLQNVVMDLPAGEHLPWALGVAHDGDQPIPILDVTALGASLVGQGTDR